MKALKGIFLSALLVVGVMAVSAGPAFASYTHVIDEDDAYTSTSGSFSDDSDCGIRGDCYYGLNVSSGATKWLEWEFWDQYCATEYCLAHEWNWSDPYIFITSEHATTHDAEYEHTAYYYDADLCPNLCSYTSWDWIDQYDYSDAWVPIANSSARQFNFVDLGNDTGETSGWYYVGWEAARVLY